MSDASDSKKPKEESDDPIVEIPSISGNTYIRKSQITRLDVRGYVVRCTICTKQINHHDSSKFKKHYRLDVLVCTDCYDFYGTSDFSQDENGYYNYCTWCGNGGKLFLCDFCPNSYCSNCIRRNFGRSEVDEATKDTWKCCICLPEKLVPKKEYCNLIIEHCKASEQRNKTKAESANKNKVAKSFSESHSWMAPSIEAIEESCKSVLKKLDKLKSKSTIKSKSAKHIVKKVEELVSNHKKDLNVYLHLLTEKCDVHFKEQKEKLENEMEEKAQAVKMNGEMNGFSSEDQKKPLKGEPNPNKNVKDETNKNVKDESNKKENVEEEVIQNKDNSSDNNGTVDEKVKLNDVNYNAKLSLLQSSESSEEEDANCSHVIEAEIHLEPVKEDDKESSEKSHDIKHNKKTKSVKLVESPVIANECNELAVSESDVLLIPDTPVKKQKKKLSSDSGKKFVLFTSSESEKSENDSNFSSEPEVKELIKKRDTKESTSYVKSEPVIDVESDQKLKLQCAVVLERTPLVTGDQTTVHIPDEINFEHLDKEINNLNKPVVLPKIKSKKTSGKIKSGDKSVKKKLEKVENDCSSSSIDLSSSGEDSETTERKKKFLANKVVEDANQIARKNLLNESSSSDSENSEDSDIVVVKKKTTKKSKAESSSDDFQPNKKKRKYDKLLCGRLSSSDENSKGGVKKSISKKKPTKRKIMSSEEEKSNKDKDTVSVSSTTSLDSDEEKEKKKKRKRVKKPASSSDENDDKEKEPDSQNTPGKGRKNIKGIISSKKLTEETKEAQLAEKERRRRVQERQKMYNVITDTAADGHEITRKLVLEVDADSKEEIVEIHPDLIEKLKPHQVRGVKFMWECTIESLKELKKSKGSGCILAHCMGLGKTLQVITFLHTCLTNKYVNKKIKTAMVICPYNTVLNWSREFDYWLGAINQEVLVHELANAKDNFMRYDILKYWKNDGGVLIISYDIFRRLATAKKIPRLSTKLRTELRDYLIDPGPDIVVCDEGHILKNCNSAISKSCCLLKTERRIVLTGTPLQNNLQEYHCMLSFVKPHLLGTAKEFRNRFVHPIINGQYEDSTQYDVKRMKKRIHILHKLLEGCVQRCDYSALTKFLPSKHEFVISVKLSEVQIKMYRWYLDNVAKYNKDSKMKMSHGSCLFADHNHLRNLCTHPYIIHTSFLRAEKRRLLKDDGEEDECFLNDESESPMSEKSGDSEVEEISKTYSTRSRRRDGEESPEELVEEAKQWYHQFISEEDKHKAELSGKIILLIDILKECEAIGDKCILFSQSLLTLDQVEDILEYLDEQEVSDEDKLRDISNTWVKNLDYFRMDGSTSADFRKQFIDMFNNPNNDRARLFLVSTRAGGLGTNLVGANRVIMLDASWNPSHDVQAIFRVYRFGQKKPVYIYRLMAQGTMEEKIYDRQVTKLSLSIRVVDEQQIERHFNAAELQELYKFEPDSQTDRPTPMVPKDTLLAEMLRKHKDWIVTYHEHDSLLQNAAEEDLTEEERQAAWNEYENEREGRINEEAMFNQENFGGFCREPNFNEVDYEGQILPSCKKMIETIISTLKANYPQDKAPQLRQKLLTSIVQLRNQFQEKHVKVLRVKQDLVGKSAVPPAVNKYLEELNLTLKELATHGQNVQELVMKDNMYQMGMNTNLPPRLPQQQPQPRNFTPSSFSNMNQYPPHVQQQILRGFLQQQNQNLQARMAHQATLNRMNYPNPSYPTRPPVITEVPDTSPPAPSNASTAASNPTSTVTIEEVP